VVHQVLKWMGPSMITFLVSKQALGIHIVM